MIKYYLSLIYHFLIENKIKILLIIVSIICFQKIGKFDDLKYERTIIKEYNIGREWLYVVENYSGASNKYKVLEFSEKMDTSSGVLIETEWHPLNLLFIVLFVILIIILLASTFHDEDYNWDIEGVRKLAIYDIIECELENGIWYYTALGRLLGTDKKRIAVDLCRVLSVNNLSDIMRCPKFKTKTKDRGDKLDKIGI
jgi:hypothetical protein